MSRKARAQWVQEDYWDKHHLRGDKRANNRAKSLRRDRWRDAASQIWFKLSFEAQVNYVNCAEKFEGKLENSRNASTGHPPHQWSILSTEQVILGFLGWKGKRKDKRGPLKSYTRVLSISVRANQAESCCNWLPLHRSDWNLNKFWREAVKISIVVENKQDSSKMRTQWSEQTSTERAQNMNEWLCFKSSWTFLIIISCVLWSSH